MYAKKKVGSGKGSYLHVTWVRATMRDRCLQGYVFVLAAGGVDRSKHTPWA
jgi:hypothetical protein